MWPFSRRKKLSPKKFGILLGDILRKTLIEISENKDQVEAQFEQRGWEFNFTQYSFAIMDMFVKIIEYKIIKDYSNCSNPKKLINNFVGDLPKEYIERAGKQLILSNLELVKSDTPLLTVSRITAQNYFDRDLGNDLGIEEVMCFGSSAKAFNEILESAIENIEVK